MYNDYGYDLALGAGALAGGMFIFFIIFFVIMLAVCVFQIVCEWKVFKKAGKGGWEAIIPIYNSWVFFEISGYPGWIALITLACCVPILNFLAAIGLLVFQILAGMSLAEKFGKEKGFGILIALLPIVGFAILAFSDATYDGSKGNQINKDEPTTNKKAKEKGEVFCSNCGTSVPKDTKFCPNCGKEI